jgi:putative SOS response-associated peptidase YedK
MCQRYALPDQLAAEREFLPATAWWKFANRFNVAAGEYVPAIRLHQGETEGIMLRWGLIPSWFEGTPQGQPHARVQSSQVQSAKNYRTAWLSSQRCILPVSGYYSWQLTPEKYLQPFFVRLNDRAVFGMAAVWDRWVSKDDDVIEGCSLICVPANEFVSHIGGPQHGMPAILRRRDYEVWLRGTPDEAQNALQTYRADWMNAYPISPRINSRAIDDSSLNRIAG